MHNFITLQDITSAKSAELVSCATTYVKYRAIIEALRKNGIDVYHPEKIGDADIADVSYKLHFIMQAAFSRDNINDDASRRELSVILDPFTLSQNVDQIIADIKEHNTKLYRIIDNFTVALSQQQARYLNAMGWMEWAAYKAKNCLSYLSHYAPIDLWVDMVGWSIEGIRKIFPTLPLPSSATMRCNPIVMSLAIMACISVMPTPTIVVSVGISMLSAASVKPDLQTATNMRRYQYLPRINQRIASYFISLSLPLTLSYLHDSELFIINSAMLLLINSATTFTLTKLLDQRYAPHIAMLMNIGTSTAISFICGNILDELRMRKALEQYAAQMAQQNNTPMPELSFPEFAQFSPYHPRYWFDQRQHVVMHEQKPAGYFRVIECSLPTLLGNANETQLLHEQGCGVVNRQGSVELSEAVQRLAIVCPRSRVEYIKDSAGCEYSEISSGSTSRLELELTRANRPEDSPRLASVVFDQDGRGIKYVSAVLADDVANIAG